MINYYRSSVRTPPKRAEAALRPIQAPTLVNWGQGDRYLGPKLAEPDHDDVPNLDRVERLSDASHWVHHDEAERAIQLLTDFFPRETNRAPLNVDAVLLDRLVGQLRHDQTAPPIVIRLRYGIYGIECDAKHAGVPLRCVRAVEVCE
jgi:hypothetical protein